MQMNTKNLSDSEKLDLILAQSREINSVLPEPAAVVESDSSERQMLAQIYEDVVAMRVEMREGFDRMNKHFDRRIGASSN